MSVMERVDLPRHVIAREQYLRIHKRLVGPKTAERLFFLYGELATSPNPEAQSMAGWAAAEASLVATHRRQSERIAMLSAAEDAWRMSLAAHRCRADEKPIHNRSAEMRIRTNLAFIPSMQSLITHRFDSRVRSHTFDSLLDIAFENLLEMRDAQFNNDPARYGNHFGLAHEQTTILAGNRLLSGRVFLMPSLARSGSGENYPSQTHDVQIANLRRGRFTTVTPMEVKAKISTSYNLPVISGRRHLGTADITSISRLYEAFARERDHTADGQDIAIAQDATDKVFHLVTHHYRAQELGMHCMRIDECMKKQETR